MRRVFVSAVLAAGAVALTVGTAPVASATTIDVQPGQSIQAAVNKAHAGDVIVVHPGAYHESVRISKNFITIRGSGDSKSGSVLEPKAGTKRCGHGSAGFCLIGRKAKTGIDPVTGTRISGFLVKGFHGFGLFAQFAKNTIVRHNSFQDNSDYGAAAFTSTGTRFLYNRASGAEEAGIYVGDSPKANATVVGNVVTGNEFGFFFRDAAVGVARNNRARGNCAGFMVLNSGAPTVPHRWTIQLNDVTHNDKKCPPIAGEGFPPLSGTGIFLLGARNNVVQHNTVWSNRPGETTPFGGGIRLESSKPFGGTNAGGNMIAHNQAYRNKPADIVWDGKGTNKFLANKCGHSQPGGLCH
jgi:parallel beta-helix repeat protein